MCSSCVCVKGCGVSSSMMPEQNQPPLYFLAEKRRQMFCKFQNRVIRSETLQHSRDRMFNKDMGNRK